MAPLTQEEVNNLKHELGALTDTEDKKMHLGMEAYEAWVYWTNLIIMLFII